MPNEKILIARSINNITINPFEYVLDEEGEPMKFNSIDEAKIFLTDKGFENFTGIHFVEEEF